MQSLTGCMTLQSLKESAEHMFAPAPTFSPPEGQAHDETLLRAFLTLGLPELSSAEDFCAVETYVRTVGRRKDDEDELPADARTSRALMFWVYPARMWGPCRETLDKTTGRLKLERHGLFMTVEQGVRVGDIVEKARQYLQVGVLKHVHVTPQWE
ncbi:hypothetical protein EXIGLDRAFT_730636 [Exidia glandulosa HHB12029]|uniref:Uncharacterized protein n=1 Tax=Exidia glandulosa HHB12029 TaxID=1314781 RepID=A0A165L6C1_EXIGL|nr:hypothetical protein EXIGLDRAFT_730636 [Exidia glandulosa HHB12029]